MTKVVNLDTFEDVVIYVRGGTLLHLVYTDSGKYLTITDRLNQTNATYRRAKDDLSYVRCCKENVGL